MPFEFTSAGLVTQTYSEALEDAQDEFRSRFSSRIATSVKSLAGQMQRIIALFDTRGQEVAQQMWQALDFRLAEGVALDQRLIGLGLTREPAERAEVLGTATSTGSITLNDGTRVSVGGFVFEIIGGPYSRVGAGTIENVRVRSELFQAIDVSTLGAWSIVDAVADWSAFDDTAQPIAGRTEETDAEFRARAETERFARAQDPLVGIDAGVGLVPGVSYARAYHNVDPNNSPNADGIEYGHVNVVVRGGEDQAVAEAIEAYGPAATPFVGATGVTLGSGALARIVGFDRVADVEIWIRVTVETSTSEDADQALGTAELEAAIEAVLLDFTAENWTIGRDVVPALLAGAITNPDAGIPAINAITIEVGDDGLAWQLTSYAITIRQQAIYSALRVIVVET